MKDKNFCPHCGQDVTAEVETEDGIFCPKCYADFWRSETIPGAEIHLYYHRTELNMMVRFKEVSMADLILAELIKLGWDKAADDVSHVVMAQMPVKTFKGTDFAKVHPPLVFEDGLVAVKAEFTSKGENVLASCTVYIKTKDEIPAKIAEFNAAVLEGLSQAFSVRMAI